MYWKAQDASNVTDRVRFPAGVPKMKIEIYLPKWNEGRKEEILEMLKEAMDALGIFQYEMKMKKE